MAGGYSALDNEGLWTKPTCITSILNSAGEECYEGAVREQVYTSDAARAITDILEGVHANGTATGIALDGDFEFACKTGTTNDNKAAWFCGYSPYYSIAVYVGADNNKVSIDGLWGGTYPAYVWRDLQNYLLNGKVIKPLLKEQLTTDGEIVEGDTDDDDASVSIVTNEERADVPDTTTQTTVGVPTQTESVPAVDSSVSNTTTVEVPTTPIPTEPEAPAPTETPTTETTESTEKTDTSDTTEKTDSTESVEESTESAVKRDPTVFSDNTEQSAGEEP